MPENREALLDHYLHMRGEMLASIAELSDDMMIDPSIDGWSVKDHLAHLAIWDDIRASEIVRISAGQESAWRMTPDEDSIFNALFHTVRLKLSLQQVLWEYESSLQRVVSALQAASSRGLDESLYGESPPRTGHDAQHAGWILRWRSERGY